jgi:hypothetical protein
LALFEKMAGSESATCRKSIVLANEFYSLFQRWKIQSGSNEDDSRMYCVIDFIINESSSPDDVVHALVLWSFSNNCGDNLYSRLRALLRRGVHYAALKGELSGTLLRLKHARTSFTEFALTPTGGKTSNRSGGIWGSMSTGDLSIDK